MDLFCKKCKLDPLVSSLLVFIANLALGKTHLLQLFTMSKISINLVYSLQRKGEGSYVPSFSLPLQASSYMAASPAALFICLKNLFRMYFI